MHWLTPHLPPTWTDENPWFLVVQFREKNAVLVIDVGRPDWLTEYSDYLTEPAYWQLMNKETLTSPLTLVVHRGESPYYLCRVIGNSATSEVVRVYGIGKVRVDGHTDRLWVLPDGTVCTGDDESHLGLLLLKERNGLM